jgi:hypothetical protein
MLDQLQDTDVVGLFFGGRAGAYAQEQGQNHEQGYKLLHGKTSLIIKSIFLPKGKEKLK